MSQCLYCSNPCEENSVFCAECRASLLKREHPLTNLQGGELAVAVREAAEPIPTLAERVKQKELNKSLGTTADEAEQEDLETPLAVEPAIQSTSKVETRPSGSRPKKRLPTRVRKALLILSIIACISFLIDGALLLAHGLRAHTLHGSAPTSAALSATATATAHGTGLSVLPGTPTTGSPGAHATPGISTTVGPGTPIAGGPSPTALPGAPTLQLSSSQLAFQYTQGQNSPTPQDLMISNSQAAPFSWQINRGNAPSWLNITPAQGSDPARSSAQVTIAIQGGQIAPGNYNAQITIYGSSSNSPLQRSPQTVTITVRVLAPCVLQVSPGNMNFTATLLNPNPPGQVLTVKESGGCGRPVSWQATPDANWVILSASSGNDPGSGNTLTIYTHANGILGVFTAHVSITATDTNGASAQGSPQTVTIKLTVVG